MTDDRPVWNQVSCSGGKDSAALVLGMWERGMQVDEVVGVDDGKWWPQAYRVFDQLREITGYQVTIISPPDNKTFDYFMFDTVITKGKRKGTKGYGWPTPLNRWCTTFCKARPLDNYIKRKEQEGYRVVVHLGIAADEAHRAAKEGGVAKVEKRFPLIEWGMTEADCLQYCYDHGIDFGGLYNHFNRLSCWCCPLMRIGDARNLYHYYPEMWEQLKDMDERARNQFKANYSVQELEDRFRREDEASLWTT